MFLALREMRRSAARFALLAVALALLLFLILFQRALQDGLITAFVGGIRNQSAPVLVFSVDAQRTLQGSVISPELEAAVLSTEGIAASARIGQGTFTVRVGDDDDDSDAAIVGSDNPELGQPVTLTGGRRAELPGEAVGSDTDFSVGDVVTVVAAGAGRDPVTLTVVGVARDVEISVTPTLFTDLPSYEAAVRAVNPEATTVLPNAIGASPVEGLAPEDLAARINESSPEADALTREAAADESPGVSDVRQSFQVIFLLYGLVVPLVTGLFFLIITLQKSRSLVLLRAVGARTRVLVWSLVAQVLIVGVAGIALGIALYAPVSQLEVGSLALRFDTDAVIFWASLFLVLAIASVLVSMRRVLAIDPIEATVGAGVR